MKGPGTRWPRLSDLTEFATGSCCNCGATDLFGEALQRWEEHDDNDRPTGTAIEVCGECVDAGVITKHPRLYRKIEEMEPFPGAMQICGGCKHQVGVNCSNPAAKRNGGTGVLVTIAQPARVHLCRSGGRGGTVFLWHQHASACKGREVNP